jgi:hypothetical protein
MHDVEPMAEVCVYTITELSKSFHPEECPQGKSQAAHDQKQTIPELNREHLRLNEQMHQFALGHLP